MMMKFLCWVELVVVAAVCSAQGFVPSVIPFDALDEENYLKVRSPVSRAVDYILSQRNPEKGWGALTSRAVIALSFAERIGAVNESDMSIAKKELNLQIFHDTMQKKSLKPGALALNINAILATCQDPRNYRNMNLVAKLRTAVDLMDESTYKSMPAVYLTLCLAKETKPNDMEKVYLIYQSAEDKTSIKALALLTLMCGYPSSSIKEQAVEQFSMALNWEMDVYTKALIIQALNALDYQSPASMISEQKQDGSFGDILSTYYAMPAILGTSFLTLKQQCQQSYNTGSSDMFSASDDTRTVTYSLKINDKDSDTHTISISFGGRKTFYDIMRLAAKRNSLYRFGYDEDGGKHIYSIAGIPNDPETGRSWKLYLQDSNVTSRKHMKKIEAGVDKIFPMEGNHFVFWFSQE